ncbi:MAG: SUMF1/EgtB/PvdO family nonheme iron enzyme, partial [Verrucomicrobiaceae bacterium]
VRDRVQSSMGGANVWKKVGGVLSYETDGKSGKIAAPVGLLAKAYEIEVAFRRKAIGEIFNIDLPITDKVILPLEIGRDKNKIVMDGVAIGIWDSLASALSGRVVVRVEHVNENELKVTTWFDSKQTGQKTRWLSELIAKNSNESHPEFPGQPITTLWCAKDSYEFTSWVLRVFDGEAKVLRAAASTSTPTGRGEPTRAAPLETPPSDKSPATATKPSGRTVDLLPLVDVSKDGVSGAWSRQTDGVAVKASQASRLQLPYWPPTEYDFVLDFTVTKGSPDVAQILCAGGRNFVWKMGAANDGNEPPHPDWFGFEKVDGQNFRTNKTKTITPWKLENGVRHSAVVAVRKDGVTATVNGKEVIQFKTDLKNLSFQPAFALKDTRLLGFAAWDCDVTFHRAEVREISGQGFLTRSVPPAATDTSSPAATTQAATKDAPFVNTLGMKFVPVPITGGPTNGQRVLFSIWETRVQDYAAYATENPQIDMLWKNYALGKERQGPTHPVLCVGWKDGKAFCAWLKKKERAAGKLGNNLEYRLPSDHEWSCAVGIGEREDANASPKAKDNKKIAGIYPWGNFWPPTKGAGNYLSEGEGAGNAGGIKGYRDDYKFTAPVGSFAPTNQGLYDLGGNVWEWCEDMYESGRPDHVMRGGSWGADASDPDKLLSSRRGFNNDGRGVMNQYGFRCVLAPTSP